MKPEPSEVKTDQSIKTGFNFKSQRLSSKWRRLFKKIVTLGTEKQERGKFFTIN